jgi:glutamate 5-kinase
MALYERAMAVHGLSVAQVLLTRSDLSIGAATKMRRERCSSCWLGVFCP